MKYKSMAKLTPRQYGIVKGSQVNGNRTQQLFNQRVDGIVRRYLN